MTNFCYNEYSKCHSNHMSSGSNASMETLVPLINGIARIVSDSWVSYYISPRPKEQLYVTGEWLAQAHALNCVPYSNQRSTVRLIDSSAKHWKLLFLTLLWIFNFTESLNAESIGSVWLVTGSVFIMFLFYVHNSINLPTKTIIYSMPANVLHNVVIILSQCCYRSAWWRLLTKCSSVTFTRATRRT